MSGQLAMQEGKLIIQAGKLGFCCCTPTACQWRVLWTYDCGLCEPGGLYPSRTYVVGTPEKITDPAAFQVPGDYPNIDGTLVMRYGANPAAACGDSPSGEDLDTSTQPSVTPSPSPCLVHWEAHLELNSTSSSFASCEECYAAMSPQGEYEWIIIATGKPHDADIDCPSAGTRSNTGDCPSDGAGGCADWIYDGTCRKVCPT